MYSFVSIAVCTGDNLDRGIKQGGDTEYYGKPGVSSKYKQCLQLGLQPWWTHYQGVPGGALNLKETLGETEYCNRVNGLEASRVCQRGIPYSRMGEKAGLKLLLTFQFDDKVHKYTSEGFQNARLAMPPSASIKKNLPSLPGQTGSGLLTAVNSDDKGRF